MKKLIITTNSSDFIVFDINSKSIVHRQEKTIGLDATHLEGQGRPTFRPFGITSDENSIYIASNDRLGKFNKTTYEFESLVEVPLYCNTHQILKDKDILYTCNTSVDTIGIYNLAKNINNQYAPIFDPKMQFLDSWACMVVQVLY